VSELSRLSRYSVPSIVSRGVLMAIHIIPASCGGIASLG
jgi:hypothetical protein